MSLVVDRIISDIVDGVVKMSLPAAGVNISLLQEQMRAALAGRCVDCNLTDYGATVAVYIKGYQNPDAQTAQNVLNAHDPKLPSAGEAKQAIVDQARAALSAINIDAVDPKTVTAEQLWGVVANIMRSLGY